MARIKVTLRRKVAAKCPPARPAAGSPTLCSAAEQYLGEGDGRVEIFRDYGADAAGRAGGFLAERSSDLAALFDQARAGILDG